MTPHRNEIVKFCPQCGCKTWTDVHGNCEWSDGHHTTDRGLTSEEWYLRQRIEKLIRKMAEGSISDDERQQLQDLQKERVRLMTSEMLRNI